jgi:hypothetical protein
MTAVTMRQRRVPDALLGRVSGLYGTVAGGAEALGALTGGVIATAAGIRAAVLAGAVPIAVVTVWAAWRHRREQSPLPQQSALRLGNAVPGYENTVLDARLYP